MEIYQNFNEDLIPILLKCFHPIVTIVTEGALSNSFYEATVTLICKSYKDSVKNENYRPVFLMNIDVKILDKILAN